MAVDIGIDLGTASILVYVKGKGVILKEPSVVAFDRDSNELTGDLSARYGQYAAVSADVVKAAHHGSKNGTPQS